MNASALVKLLESYRYPTANESVLQAAIERVLKAHGSSFERECYLFQGAPLRVVNETLNYGTVTYETCGEVTEEDVAWKRRDRIDFLVGRVGLEVKTQGSANDLTRQLHRYTECDRVDELVLFTTKTRLCKQPETLNGKPLLVALYSPGVA